MAQNAQIQPWQTNLKGKVPLAAENAFRLLYDAIQDHDTAIVALNTKVTNLTPAAAAAAASTPSAPSAPSTSSFPNLGDVNQQAGSTYATSLTDNGGLIILSFAGAVAVTLTSTVTAPFFVSLLNLATGSATLTPSGGTINSAGSLVIRSTGWCILYFDGTNWWSLALPGVLPAATASVPHQWFSAYSAATGTFTQSQPTVGDVSGAAPIANPTFTGVVTQPDASVLTAATLTTTATLGTATALPALPAEYVTVSINGTSYKIPLYLL